MIESARIEPERLAWIAIAAFSLRAYSVSGEYPTDTPILSIPTKPIS